MAGHAHGAPPLVEGLAGVRDHGVEQHQAAHVEPADRERCREATHRLRHQNDVGAVPGGGHDRVGVRRQPGVRVAGRQVDRDSVGPEQGSEEVPVVAVTAGTGDQDEGHAARTPAAS